MFNSITLSIKVKSCIVRCTSQHINILKSYSLRILPAINNNYNIFQTNSLSIKILAGN